MENSNEDIDSSKLLFSSTSDSSEKSLKLKLEAQDDGGGSLEDLNLLDESFKPNKPHFLDYVCVTNVEFSEQTNQIIETKLPVEKPRRPQQTIISNNSLGEFSGNCSNVVKQSSKSIQSESKFISSGSEEKVPLCGSLPTTDSVYSILTMLGSINSNEIATKFLEYSKNREMCVALRRSGCISLLVQIIHSDSSDDEVRSKVCQALHNIVLNFSDDKSGRREARVLKLIEQLFEYCDTLRTILMGNTLEDNVDRHPIQAIGTLMKISFDEEHRFCMTQLGALQTISKLIQLDYAVHGPANNNDVNCITLRRYAGMTLTNLTFGDCNNKAILCSNKVFMKALIDQINANSDELVQVTASVIRNLSWRADTNMKEVLNEIGTVKVLTLAAMRCAQENTLKAILSALWNLSNHCAKNKAEFCELDGAIEFLIDMLSYEAPSKTMSVIENTGGILRNISSHIATKEELRVILRRKNCFSILLQQLKSPSLTVVSNACGTLGNLSAHCSEDQKFLRDNGAIPMLRSLIYSKHKMISTGSNIALRHLIGCRSSVTHNENMDSVAKMMDLKELPTLNVRKQRAMEHELDKNLAENYDTDDQISPTSDKAGNDEKATGSSSKIYSKDETENNRDGMKSSSKKERKVQNIEDDDDEEDEDAPVNFSAKYSNNDGERGEYQETNLDQITDYSIRYAENQSESDEEVPKRGSNLESEDATRCYNTEDTPHTISHATSMTDLRGQSSKTKLKEKPPLKQKTPSEEKKEKLPQTYSTSGIQSPEKTVNYCEEGTPGFFSRNDSLSDLEESPDQSKKDKSLSNRNEKAKLANLKKEEEANNVEKIPQESTAATPKSVTFVNLADETPLMFSRTSSMGSLSSAEPACVDDKSSIVSDFSRLASGIISPSELPDSPTQSIPQSPSRHVHRVPKIETTAPLPSIPAVEIEDITEPGTSGQGHQSIFEDNTNTFHIENTPALFSYATSLSNLSFDDEPKISTDALSKDFRLISHPSEDHEKEDDPQKPVVVKTETQDEENFGECSRNPQTENVSDEESANDTFLLEDCINMGMNRNVKKSPVHEKKEPILQKSPVNGNESSTSENDDQILEAVIREGMPKFPVKALKENPVDMMRSGAPLLPPYLPVVDEMNRFVVEDSPCNFSVMSALSAITIESNMQPGPSNPKSPVNPNSASINDPKKITAAPRLLDKPRLPPEYDDSLSSLSIESEDDGNLLNMAISAGVNAKPKQKPPPTNPINIPIKKSENAANDSISSLESGDSKREDQSNSILEQCIRSGIDNVVKTDSSKDNTSGPHSFITSSPKKSGMPTFTKAPIPAPRKKNEMDKRDEELLMECINTGILRNTRTGYDPAAGGGSYNQDMLIGMKKLAISGSENTTADPKNAETTPVIVKDQTAGVLTSSQNLNNTITGVEVAVEKKMKMKIDSMFCSNESGIDPTLKEIERENQEANGNSIAIRNEHSPLVNWMMLNGSNCSFDLNGSMSSFENMLERSNEYPAALLGASYDEDDSMNTMEISNEFMIDQRDEYIRIDEKHKDPNLMLKSVDRLTQELVSTAEFLRKNSGINGEEMSSHSNTWNDENSFPSISMSAPMIASTNDDVTLASEQIFLEDKTPTNDNIKISNLFQRSEDTFDGKSVNQQANKKMFWSGNFGESKEFLESLGMSPKKEDMSRSYNKKMEEARKKMFYSSSLVEAGFLEEDNPIVIKSSSKKPNQTTWCEISSVNSGNYMQNDTSSKKNIVWYEQQNTKINPDEPKSNQFWINLDELPDVDTQRRLMEEKRRESSGKNSLTWEISLDDDIGSAKNGKIIKNRRSGDGAERSESPAKLKVSSRKSSGAGLNLTNDENIEMSGESSPLSGRKSGGSGMSQNTAEKTRLADSPRNNGKQLKSGDFSPLFTRKSMENGNKKLPSIEYSKVSKINGKKPEDFVQNSSRKSSTGNINLIHTEKPEFSSEEEIPKVNINFKLGGEINFKLGGEVNNPTLNSFNYLNFGPTSIETCSTLSNSTIVTVEAQKMLQHMDESAHSLNLESVRPPSSFDCISMTSMQESTNGSPFHNRNGGKKPLMSGLVAKRALGQQIFSSSIESVNSMNNIDNIRPPSIMDELLDSMISVDSIISEVVDPTLCADDIPGITNYETALSDVEDSLTLRSCQDLSKDETLTPVSSDFSSVESTPTKRKTPPNKKRHSERDRFKTYTINVDMILKEQQAKEKLGSPPRTNPRQRRQEDRKRFETQVIEHNLGSISPVRLQRRQADPDRFKTHTIESPTLGNQDQEQDDLSIRAMTANFEFIRSEVAQSSSSSANTSNIRQKLNRIKTNNQNHEDSLEFEHQTSETESQRDLKYSLQYEIVQSDPPVVEEQRKVEPEKVKKEEKSKLAIATGKSKASNYISPYRMTTRVVPAAAKTKPNKVTKTPIIAKIVQRKSDSNATESKGSSVMQKNNKVNTVTAKIPKHGFAKPTLKAKSAPSSTLDTPVTPTTPAIPLNRQGTFIKDEPTCENVPIVDNTPISPVKIMPATKLKPPKAVSKYSTPADKKPDTSSPKKSSNLPSLKFRSNSNTSMKSSSSREKDLNNITPVRSNSGINLSNPKKNITSKIAGLWKNPEKKTISTSSSQLNGNGSAAKQPTPTVAQKKSFATFTKDKIKRSSTFNDIDKK